MVTAERTAAAAAAVGIISYAATALAEAAEGEEARSRRSGAAENLRLFGPRSPHFIYSQAHGRSRRGGVAARGRGGGGGVLGAYDDFFEYTGPRRRRVHSRQLIRRVASRPVPFEL